MQAQDLVGSETLHHRVLICHDERHIVRLIEVNLNRQGHQVFTSSDVPCAIKRLRDGVLRTSESFSRVLVKGSLVGGDAYEILTWIRTNLPEQSIWVGVMIASQSEQREWERRPCQPDAYFPVPFNPSENF